MSAIIPAILPASREELAQKLLLLQGVATEVQIDVIDGKYAAAPASWPYAEGDSVPQEDELVTLTGPIRFEIDLMARTPEEVLGSWMRAGAHRLTVHAESTAQLSELVSSMRTKYGHDKEFAPGLFSFGLAIGMATETALIEPYLSECDYIQFMGITTIGKQGQMFDSRVIPKIAAFHRKYPDMPIQVDGGVSLENIPQLLRAGASRLVVGSAFWRAQDPKSELTKMMQLAQTSGLFG